jgi:hypothetical protein
MDDLFNPFPVKGYISKKYFCDREDEIKTLYNHLQNRIDTTLISPRRMGKTGLILRFFDQLKETGRFKYVYTDIFPTRNLSDFIKVFSESILKEFPERTSIGKLFMTFIKGLRPLISYDPLTGSPQVQINYQTIQEKEQTLNGLIVFLEGLKKNMVVAIDEFQQIADYPEKNMEALLRTYTQNLKNVRFIYCGSKKKMMFDIFANAKRPFYGSTRFIVLDNIDREKYIPFITKQFKESRKTLTAEAMEMILDWTRCHTFYTQSLCNIIYSYPVKKITVETVKTACVDLLKRNEAIYLQYRQMLTPAQWNYLIAIAKEGEVRQITAQHFIAKYGIGTPANSRRICKSLLGKELLLEETSKKQITYRVYDVFLSRWLESEY